ncbi:hypothetical protein N0700_24100, partial [Pseudomonas aeruginosa]|nr:hypothetical protein [Pseudomonas aeruginosa]MCS9542985.1 hypothetical protein [Pseudomonas aeruginosa]MCT0590635.1 hypothetical protein [Pseudomonas aeruginosa]
LGVFRGHFYRVIDFPNPRQNCHRTTAGEQGVAVRLQRYAGCWHVFQAHAGVLASADRALDEAAAFVVECSAEGDRCRTF